MSDLNSIDTIIRAALTTRDKSVKSLRAAMLTALDPIPMHAVIADAAGEICRIVPVKTGASQWANTTWEITIKGWAAITPAGEMLVECLDRSESDGNNVHYRSTEPTVSDDYEFPLKFCGAAILRSAARRLPAAIANYVEALGQKCSAEAAANAAAESTLTAAKG